MKNLTLIYLPFLWPLPHNLLPPQFYSSVLAYGIYAQVLAISLSYSLFLTYLPIYEIHAKKLLFLLLTCLFEQSPA